MEAHHTAQTAELRQTMLTYLAVFKEQTADKHKRGILAKIRCYNDATEEEQIRVQIIDGLLVAVVDAMYDDDHPSAEIWASYIAGIPGPLSNGYELEIYARNKRTKEAINRAKQFPPKSAADENCARAPLWWWVSPWR
jgi:hypothetical protein